MKKPSCFSTKIDLSLAEKLKNDLINQGFQICQPPYTVFSGLKKGVTCTLYESGKLTVQGKEKDAFIEFYLEPEILKNFSYTHPLADIDLTPRIGVDEAGKGDFFGPLCVASFYSDEKGIEKLIKLGIKDSKRFTDGKIIKLGKEIRKEFPHSIVKMMPEKYNVLYPKFGNLNRLLAWMHATAIENLTQKTGCRKVIVDKFANERVVENALAQKKVEVDLIQKVRAEEDVVVAAASVLARLAFLEQMDHLSEVISFDLPKGASHLVIEAGKKIIAKFDEDMLDKVSKTHFKTREEILSG